MIITYKSISLFFSNEYNFIYYGLYTGYSKESPQLTAQQRLSHLKTVNLRVLLYCILEKIIPKMSHHYRFSILRLQIHKHRNRLPIQYRLITSATLFSSSHITKLQLLINSTCHIIKYCATHYNNFVYGSRECDYIEILAIVWVPSN